MSQTNAVSENDAEIIIAGDEGEVIPTDDDADVMCALRQIDGVDRAFFGSRTGNVYVSIWQNDIPRQVFDVAKNHGLNHDATHTTLREVTLCFKG